jgi:hypothetical protein
MRRAKQYGRNLYLAFHLRITDTTKPIQFINRLLERLELRLILERQDNTKKRFYRLDPDKLNDPERLAVLRAIAFVEIAFPKMVRSG